MNLLFLSNKINLRKMQMIKIINKIGHYFYVRRLFCNLNKKKENLGAFKTNLIK